jgi:hypothetical protein
VAHILKFTTLHEYDPADRGISVPVILGIGQAREKALAKLDTGASFCIFKKEHGEALGLEIEKGQKEIISTPTGIFSAYGHEISLFALGFQLDAMVYFTTMSGFNRNVLRRHGWLQQLRLAIIDYDGKLFVSRYEDEN